MTWKPQSGGRIGDHADPLSSFYLARGLGERPRLFLFNTIVMRGYARRRYEGGVRVRGGVGLVVGVVVIIILIFVLMRVL